MALPSGRASSRGHHAARHTVPARQRRPRDPVAYHYREARWCAPCVIERLLERTELRDVSMSLDDEVCLDRLAHALALARHDEDSYQASAFPKTVTAGELAAGERCCSCHRPLA